MKTINIQLTDSEENEIVRFRDFMYAESTDADYSIDVLERATHSGEMGVGGLTGAAAVSVKETGNALATVLEKIFSFSNLFKKRIRIEIEGRIIEYEGLNPEKSMKVIAELLDKLKEK